MLGTIAGIASGIGSLASGFGLGSSKGPKAADVFDWQKKWEKKKALDGPSWLVKGAKKAGLSPLAVLGTQPIGSPTVSVGGSDNSFNPAEIGQGVSRALNAGRSAVERKMDDLLLEKAQLENDFLKTQIAGSVRAITNTGGTVPISSSPSTGTGGNVVVVPDTQVSKDKNDSGRTAGTHAAMSVYDLGNGQTIELPYSEEGPSESLESIPWPFNILKWAELGYKRNWKHTPSGWAHSYTKKLQKKYPNTYKKN